MKKKIRRREFLDTSAKMGLGAAIGGGLGIPFFRGSRLQAFGEKKIGIAVVKGTDYLKNTLKAVNLLGGMEKFVPQDSKVAILPNSQRDNPGTYTKPEIVRATIRMCKKAGAKEVNCLSWLAQKSWDATGLGKAVEEEGANLLLFDRKDESVWKMVPVPKGKIFKEAKVLKAFYAHDVFIDMPITKDHAGNRFTGTMKNMMGLNGNNLFFHTGKFKAPDDIEHLDQCIADLNTIFTPDLCIVDGTELITTNGPFGPGELVKPMKIIAGVDRVAVDSYSCTLWGLEGKDIIMIQRGYEHGLGEIDLTKVKIKEVEA